MSGAIVAQAINESIGTAGFQGLDAILKEYLGRIAEQAGTTRVPISRTINGYPLASDVNLTNDDVGAAPAGYGLGENNTILVSDANDAVRVGFYRFNPTNGTNFPTVYGNMRYGSFVVTRVYGTVQQIAVYENVIAVRYGYVDSGEWSDWEYLNPPMLLGVEYRTTERFLGKPVYVKLVDFGEMPNNSYKSLKVISHGNIFSYEGVMLDAGGNATVVPTENYATTLNSNAIQVNVSTHVITVATNRDLSAHTALFKIKYYIP